MLQTSEAKPPAAGTKFTLYCSLKPGVPMGDEKPLSIFLEAVRQRADNDVAGLKALCEAEARAI